MKTCKDCGFVGNVSEFAPRRLRCHKCYAEWQKQKRLRNIDRLKEYDRNRYVGERRAKQKATSSKWYYNNQVLVKQRVSGYYYKDRSYTKFQSLKNTYGLSKEQYQEMLEISKGLCEICGGKTSRMCVDHNHNTGQIRGMLCHTCNSAIGFLKDNINLLESAKAYLIKYQNQNDSHESDRIILEN